MAYKKRTTKGRRVAKRKAPYKKRALSMAKLTKQVRAIKRNFKPELKEVVMTNANLATYVGQVAGNTVGYFAADLTPLPGQGTSTSGRIGSKIRIKKIGAEFQFIAEGNLNTPINLKICFIRVKGIPIGPTTVVNDVWKVNPFIYTSLGVNAGVVDYNSYVDTDYRRNFTFLGYRRVHFPMEQYAAGVGVKTVKMNMNFKTPITVNFDNNTNNVASGQIVCVILADAGNYSATVASTFTGIPIGSVSSALQMNYVTTNYYFDD